MNYEQKYLKYKQKYLDLKKQIAGGKFRGVARPGYAVNTSEKFLIDVLIYGELPAGVVTAHYDKTENYVAFVAFNNSYPKCTINWNISPLSRAYDYIKQNEKEIIDTAIKVFKATYPTYQPEKTWL